MFGVGCLGLDDATRRTELHAAKPKPQQESWTFNWTYVRILVLLLFFLYVVLIYFCTLLFFVRFGFALSTTITDRSTHCRRGLSRLGTSNYTIIYYTGVSATTDAS